MNWSFVSNPLEVRGVRQRTRTKGDKQGETYFIVVCEDDNAYQTEFTVNDSADFELVHKLKKGEIYRFPIVVVATREYQFARLGDGQIWHVTPDGELEEL